MKKLLTVILIINGKKAKKQTLLGHQNPITLELRLAKRENFYINKKKMKYGNLINEKEEVISKYLENKH